MYDLTPSRPLPQQQVASISLSCCVLPFDLLKGEGPGGEGLGEELNHTAAIKPGPLQFTQYSLLLSKVTEKEIEYMRTVLRIRIRDPVLF